MEYSPDLNWFASKTKVIILAVGVQRPWTWALNAHREGRNHKLVYLWETPMTRHVTRMTIDDAEHYSPAERAAIVASYPAHERKARAEGGGLRGRTLRGR